MTEGVAARRRETIGKELPVTSARPRRMINSTSVHACADKLASVQKNNLCDCDSL
jgi:hypothetical protein